MSAGMTARQGQVDQVVIVHGIHIGPTGQYLAEMLTGNAGAGEYAQQLMPVPCVDRGAQGVEIAAKDIESAQYRLAVGEEDIAPHHRIAAGDPCEIAKAAGGIAKDFQVFVALGQRVHEAEGQQMRQMAGGGEHLVVALDGHALDHRPKPPPESVDQRQCLGLALLHRCQDDLVMEEQFAVGRRHAAALGAGDRMARHEVQGPAGEGPPRRLQHISLGAADIGDDGVAQSEPGEYAEQLLHGQDGDGELDHLRAPAGDGEVLLATVDHTLGHGQFAGMRVQIHADDLATQATLADPLGEGAADQPQSHHDQAADPGLFPLRRGGSRECMLRHWREPSAAPPGSGRSLPADRWIPAGRSACHNRPLDAL